jgi:hypothetical protein
MPLPTHLRQLIEHFSQSFHLVPVR